MDISERQVIYSPKYEGTNNLIKRRFRLNRMVCRAWVQKQTPLNSHWLVLTNGGADFYHFWFVDSM